jgi:hypothetical protein
MTLSTTLTPRSDELLERLQPGSANSNDFERSYAIARLKRLERLQ